jgi:predicted RNA binding protein YcfA (HicA-like mRNA interferase family)
MDSARLLDRVSRGDVANVSFRDFSGLLADLGFVPCRIRGSHHIYRHPSMPELVNIQSVGGMVKPYQVRQVWRLVERYNLKLEGGR